VVELHSQEVPTCFVDPIREPFAQSFELSKGRVKFLDWSDSVLFSEVYPPEGLACLTEVDLSVGHGIHRVEVVPLLEADVDEFGFSVFFHIFEVWEHRHVEYFPQSPFVALFEDVMELSVGRELFNLLP
jgi:hypothetical protein